MVGDGRKEKSLILNKLKKDKMVNYKRTLDRIIAETDFSVVPENGIKYVIRNYPLGYKFHAYNKCRRPLWIYYFNVTGVYDAQDVVGQKLRIDIIGIS
jgi:hypothetical protein